MHAESTRVVAWRRLLLLGLISLIALMATSFAAPRDANAFVDPTIVRPTTKGWVEIRAFGSSDMCGIVGPCGVGAYRWTGYQWDATKIGWSTKVYAWPYASGWHWVWTERTGWLAVKTSDLRTGYSCTGWQCPVF